MRRLLRLWLLLLAACGPTGAEIRQKADAIAQSANLHKVEVQGGAFTFVMYERASDPAAPVRVYIEGDGHAWLTRNQVSPDPTPIDPTALTLAALDRSPNVVYMARVCQYVMSAPCNTQYWTRAQFSETVIASVNQAMNRWPGHKLELVGYSGGAAVALLIAQRRDDVVNIRTIAGNIDTKAFTNAHHLSPLLESMNPADNAPRTALIPQLHFVGEDDKVVPRTVSQSYENRLPSANCSMVTTVANATHISGWTDQWQALLAQKMPCSGAIK